ncbi:MAG: hypothetical protein ABSF71_18650 [Terriglobia bacterium]
MGFITVPAAGGYILSAPLGLNWASSHTFSAQRFRNHPYGFPRIGAGREFLPPRGRIRY